MFKVLLLLSLAALGSARLTTSGTNLLYNGNKVFLSGANIAWKSYGYDFGNGQYANSKSTLENWVSQIANNGGNTVRIWLHVEGENTPAFDGNGFVTGLDKTGTMISDMKAFLDYAKSWNVLVVFALWNGATTFTNQNIKNLFYDSNKLQSYIDKALKPMVSALGNHPALGAWEIINEPEGSVLNGQSNSNSCFDTTPLGPTGAGFGKNGVPMQNILKFVNWQAQAVKETNSANLVTVGSWSEHGQTNAFANSRNYFSDACLIAGGGKSLGKLDFYQMHTYSSGGHWNTNAPYKTTAASYGLDKPLVIGEFAAVCSEGQSAQTLFQYFYGHGYQGAWSWHFNGGGECSDSQAAQNAGLQTLKSTRFTL